MAHAKNLQPARIETRGLRARIDALTLVAGSASAAEIADAALCYLLKLTTSNDFERQLREHAELDYKEAKEFRLNLVGNFEFVGALKAWALTHLVTPYQNLRSALAGGLEMGAMQADMVAAWPTACDLQKLAASRRRSPMAIKLRALIKDLRVSEGARVALDPRKGQQVLAQIEPELRKHAKRRAWHKLRFISDSNNEDMNDLISNLVTQAIQRFWWMIPTSKSALHVLNSLRTAVNGLVINQIQWWTAKCRSRLDSDGVGGYTLRTMSQNQIGAEVQYHELADAESVSADTTKPSENRLAVLAISKYVEETKGPGTNRLLMLLTGMHDPEFSAYLVARGLPENDEFYETVDLDTYMREASASCGLGARIAQTLLTDLRRRFG